MREFDFLQTSVFTDERYLFSGNQLATFWNLTTEDDLTTEEMQGITREMNFSETTFVLPATLERCIRKVRIFTPGRELPFAGHPTLGTAFVLKHQEIIDESSENSLELGIGPIEVSFRDENQVLMHQHVPEFMEEYQDSNAISNILRISPDSISLKWPMQFVSTGNSFLIVTLKSLTAMRSIRLNSNLLMETLEDYPSQQLVVLALDTVHNDSHAHVRMFAPSLGVIEDPATGSAAGPIGSYLEVHQVIDAHDKGEEIVLEQGYEIHRPSRLIVQCPYDGDDISDVIVGGNVRLTAQGRFFLPDETTN
ncbi:MAG: PhzF family phenazine biosynthesis protein [Candidatus Hodarchaeales archaeon]|jgi:trans-2,3-dihydro-3-hydroxyanthranilate isomerase